MKNNFYSILNSELKRIDSVHTSKRNEKIITGFSLDHKAIMNDEKYSIFNSNDYLGLKFHKDVIKAEHDASEIYGAGPGSVRFISGTLKVYKDLEKKLATFHGRDDAMVFSSAFATNLAVIFCLAKGQSKDSLLTGETLIISDALNHRSIIDGIRIANLLPEQKKIYKHLNYEDLDSQLQENKGKFQRVLVITDGIFSMLGEHADLKKLRTIVDKYDTYFNEGVMLIVDDSHGVGAFGKKGRGTEEVSQAKCDVLIGTLGKAFGADGGYVVADQVVIDYLRESAATYIYSNSISPSVAAAALKSVEIVDSNEGVNLLQKLQTTITYFKEYMKQTVFSLASDSFHPIQPILIGDAEKANQIANDLFKKHILVTTISYPVVSPGKDEIRVQLNALQTKSDLATFISILKTYDH